MKDHSNKLLKAARPKIFPGRQALEVFAFQERLDASQWFSPEKIGAYQLHQLKALARFAASTVEAYQGGLDVARIERATHLDEALSAIPILRRDTLARESQSFRAPHLPAGHELTGAKSSSGTSGQVVSVATTNIAFGWQNALTWRSHLWAGRDFSQTVAGIRTDRKVSAPYPDGVTTPQWDAATVFPFTTGPGRHLGTSTSLELQWEWLTRVRPAYLLTYPSIVRAFASRAKAEGRGPCALRGISTVGETVDADLRDDSARYLGAEIHDLYSAEEVGAIAIQCPTCRRYHAQDEAAIVEILDDTGRPCRAGATGRVVVTPLFNYATPLLRYDIGDIAEAGTACACGRGLKTINRIVGRHRNIFKLADGTSFWPSFGAKAFSSIIQVRQHQFRQTGYDQLEVVLATDAPVDADQEAQVRNTILKRMPIPMQISFRYVAEIAREAGGKYQEFVCLIE